MFAQNCFLGQVGVGDGWGATSVKQKEKSSVVWFVKPDIAGAVLVA